MTPLEITAGVPGPLSLTHPIAFDGLLGAVEAARRQLPPPSLGLVDDLAIPLARHERGFYRASQAHLVVAEYEVRHWARRMPSLPMLALLSSAERLPTAGRYKAFYMPLRCVLPQGARLTWWAVGDAREVADQLCHVHALGYKRASGYGWVASWTVREVDEDRSLVTVEGAPARTLPADMAPAGWGHFREARLTPPYWQRDGAELCAVPAPVEEAWA